METPILRVREGHNSSPDSGVGVRYREVGRDVTRIENKPLCRVASGVLSFK